MRGLARHLTGLIPVVAFVLLIANAASAATLKVGAGQPYQKIQDAITAAHNGDVVMVAPGTYAEYASFAGKAITVQSTDPTNPATVAATIITGDGKMGVYFDGKETSSSVLDGFTVTGCLQGDGIYVSTGASPILRRNVVTGNKIGIHVVGGTPTIENSTVTGNKGPGIWTTGGTVRNNVIKGNTGAGIGLLGTGTIQGNTITGNNNPMNLSGGGIYVGGYQAGTKALIKLNLLAGNTAFVGGGIMISPSQMDVTIDGNTIVGNKALSGQGGGIGLCVFGSAPASFGHIKLTNNIIAGALDGGGLAATRLAGAPLPAVTYCDVYGNQGGDYLNGIAAGTGCISVDPLFVKAAAGDYRLKSCNGRWTGTAWLRDFVTSPCIDAGDPAQPVGREPAPNDGIINLGFDGGTQYASKSSMVTVMSFAYPSNTKPWRPWGWTYKWPVDHASAEAHITLRPATSPTGWGAPMAATLHWTGNTLTFMPANFAANGRYLLTLATGVAKTAGGTIGWGESWAFKTDGKGWPVFDASFAQ